MKLLDLHKLLASHRIIGGPMIGPFLAMRTNAAEHATIAREFARIAGGARNTRAASRAAPQGSPYRASTIQQRAAVADHRTHDQRWATALHESGHCIVAIALGATPSRVSIRANATSGGRMEADLSKLGAMEQIAVLAAGHAARALMLRQPFDEAVLEQSGDGEMIAAISGGDRMLAAEGAVMACSIIHPRRNQVERLASELTIRNELNLPDMLRAMRGALAS